MQTGHLHDGEFSTPTEKDFKLIDKGLKAWYSKLSKYGLVG